MLSAVLLAGRVSGFFREIEIGYFFGLSHEADFTVLLLTLPDLLVNLLLAGGLSAVLIPEFRQSSPEQAALLFRRSSWLIGIIFLTVAVVVAVYPKAILVLLAPGLLDAPKAAFGLAFAIMAIAIPLAALSGITTALLNANDRFLVAGSGTLLFNGVVIMLLPLSVGFQNPLIVLAISIAAGALARYGAQLVGSARFWNRPAIGRTPQGFDLAQRFAHALTAATIIQLIPVALRAAMSFGLPGTVAAFAFAFKLVELPNTVVVASLATVAFPAISEHVKNGELGATRNYITSRTQSSLAAALSVTLPSILFAPAFVDVVYGHGKMTADALDLVTMLMRIGLLYLPCLAVTTMVTALLYARKQTWLLLKVTSLCLISVAVAALPAVWTGRPELSIIAMPIFHGILAISLSRASGYGTLFWVDVRILYKIAAVVVITLMAAGIDHVVNSSGHALVSATIGLSSIAISLFLSGIPPGREGIKRAFDLIVGGIATLVASPVLAGVAAIILATDFGPVFYRQQRTGQHGQTFTIFKFRSMVVNADKIGGYSTLDGDPRITRIGQFLRKTSLDELPQLINVLRGDMSIVGPRPDVPAQRAFYTDEEFAKRNSVRPGITGLAQVEKRSAASIEARKMLDLEYIERHNLGLDIQISFRTAARLFKLRGN